MSEFLLGRIAATKSLILAYEDAVLALTTTNVESYTLDTGQGRQQVTRRNIKEMNEGIDLLMNRLVCYEARAYGTGTINMSRV